MNNSQAILDFEQRCEALGSDATERQVSSLLSWAQECLRRDELEIAATIAAMYGVPGLYTDIRMIQGEGV